MFDMIAHLTRQAAFSRATFGPGPRTDGVIDHIESEIEEIQDAPTAQDRSKEWTDVAILGLDGLLRACRAEMEDLHPNKPVTNDMVAKQALRRIVEKQALNELRDWPDWRTVPTDRAIEHVRRSDDE